MMRTGMLPSRITCPIGSLPSLNSALRALSSITPTCDCSRIASASNARPDANLLPCTRKNLSPTPLTEPVTSMLPRRSVTPVL